MFHRCGAKIVDHWFLLLPSNLHLAGMVPEWIADFWQTLPVIHVGSPSQITNPYSWSSQLLPLLTISQVPRCIRVQALCNDLSRFSLTQRKLAIDGCGKFNTSSVVHSLVCWNQWYNSVCHFQIAWKQSQGSIILRSAVRTTRKKWFDKVNSAIMEIILVVSKVNLGADDLEESGETNK